VHRYEEQNSEQTLAEGLSEYYRDNANLVPRSKLSAEASEFFRCHDTAHVVFGCDISLNDEAMVKIYSIFGTSGAFGILKGYRLHESGEIYRKLSIVEVVKTAFAAVVLIPRTMLKCRSQRGRWPWNQFDDQLSVPLKKLREEYGVRVAHLNHPPP
jgi:hypothetical protein